MNLNAEIGSKRLFHPRLAVILALAIFLGACHQRKVLVLGPAMPSMEKVAPGLVIELAKVEDGREEIEHIGKLRNGFGKVVGHIYSDIPVEVLYTQEFLKLLKKAGYRAELAGAGSSKTPVLNASIVSKGVWFNGAAIEAKVEMDLELTRSGKKLLTHELKGQQVRTALFIITTKSFENVMNEAMDKLMEQLADWVTSKKFQESVSSK